MTALYGAPRPARLAGNEALIELRDLTLDFGGNGRSVRVLHGIDLAIHRGESVGLVGESGCGKSVTWLAALGLLDRRARITGQVIIHGRAISEMDPAEISRTRGGRVGMIFQDPMSSLNPVHRVGWQINEALSIHQGLRGAAAQSEARRLMDRVGIANAKERLNAYPHELSGGMSQRVMIAMALAGAPDVLIADEPTTALDVTIQAQILELIQEIQRERGMALVLISHDLGVVAETCERVAVMYCGRIIEEAATDALFEQPRHPYTRGLLNARPGMTTCRRRLEPVHGSVPSPDEMPKGCAFAPRCPDATMRCHAVPRRIEFEPGHEAACHHPIEPSYPARERALT